MAQCSLIYLGLRPGKPGLSKLLPPHQDHYSRLPTGVPGSSPPLHESLSSQPCHSHLKTSQPLLIRTPSQSHLNFLFKNRAQTSKVDSLETNHLAQAWTDCVWTWRNCLSPLSLSFIVSTMETITAPTYNIGLMWFPQDAINKAQEIPLLTASNFMSCNLPLVHSTPASPGLGLWLVFFLFSLTFSVACLSCHSELKCNLTIMLSRFSRVWLFVTLWAAAHQAPLSMGFFRQE